MSWINAMQWPALAMTLVAAWLVGTERKFKRNWGFWVFLLSNVLWIVWESARSRLCVYLSFGVPWFSQRARRA